MSGRDFLGTGWRFPIRIGPGGGLAYGSAELDVREAIWIVLGTARGERPMRPRFGCGIRDYVFAPNTPATHGAIAHEVRTALTEWEPRIDVVDVRVGARDESTLLIHVDYRLRATNTMSNLVYPFHIGEGVAA